MPWRSWTTALARALSTTLLLALTGLGQPVVAQRATETDVSRGQLLYATHCLECHNSRMHWRDRRLATDWASLKAQVRHWQALAFLNWSEADITEVTRHLNDTIYRFAPTGEQLGLVRPRSGR